MTTAPRQELVDALNVSARAAALNIFVIEEAADEVENFADVGLELVRGVVEAWVESLLHLLSASYLVAPSSEEGLEEVL